MFDHRRVSIGCSQTTIGLGRVHDSKIVSTSLLNPTEFPIVACHERWFRSYYDSNAISALILCLTELSIETLEQILPHLPGQDIRCQKRYGASLPFHPECSPPVARSKLAGNFRNGLAIYQPFDANATASPLAWLKPLVAPRFFWTLSGDRPIPIHYHPHHFGYATGYEHAKCPLDPRVAQVGYRLKVPTLLLSEEPFSLFFSAHDPLPS